MRSATMRAAALGTIAAACAVAGCGSSTHSSSAAANISSTANGSAAANSASNTTSDTTTSSPAPAASTKLTAPGSMLKPGQSAIVDFDSTTASGGNGPTYRLQLTIESITPGAVSDFNGISLSGVPKHSTPTYVRLRMTNLSTHAIDTSNTDPVDSVQAVEPSGQMDNSLIISGYFPHCPDADTPSPFAAGQSFTTCQTFFERGGASKVGYNGSNATLDSPIIWSK